MRSESVVAMIAVSALLLTATRSSDVHPLLRTGSKDPSSGRRLSRTYEHMTTEQKLLDLLSLPMNKGFKYQCPHVVSIAGNDAADGRSDAIVPVRKRNDFHLRGTALGGWLVLEPWITPSLFYQFLGATKKWGGDAQNRVAIDSHTFCTALGKEEANRQLRRHWKTWVDEEQIANLAKMEVQSVRIPVGDWMFQPYEPYIGCWDGALEELDRGIALCAKHNISVLIDVHTAVGGQNGLDNGGTTGHFEWFTNPSSGSLQYRHWEIRGGDWIGNFNTTSQKYESINTDHFLHSVRVVDAVLERYADSPTVIGIEPLNEPWLTIPWPVLQEFYWRCYQLVQLRAPHWITLLHDSFRLSPETWGPSEGGSGFMQYCDNYAVDTHIYQAWAWPSETSEFSRLTCTADGQHVQEMEALGVPIVVGEWSLATDNCAMWLNGFQDNVPGYPMVKCDLVDCPAPYMGPDQPGAPPDPRLPAQDPFGTGGNSTVVYGKCPVDKALPLAQELSEIRKLAHAKLQAFDLHTHGNYFWNFRTEFGSRWSYQKAVELGWLPSRWSEPDPATRESIAHACDAFPLPHTPTHAPTPTHMPTHTHSSPSATTAVPAEHPQHEHEGEAHEAVAGLSAASDDLMRAQSVRESNPVAVISGREDPKNRIYAGDGVKFGNSGSDSGSFTTSESLKSAAESASAEQPPNFGAEWSALYALLGAGFLSLHVLALALLYRRTISAGVLGTVKPDGNLPPTPIRPDRSHHSYHSSSTNHLYRENGATYSREFSQELPLDPSEERAAAEAEEAGGEGDGEIERSQESDEMDKSQLAESQTRAEPNSSRLSRSALGELDYSRHCSPGGRLEDRPNTVFSPFMQWVTERIFGPGEDYLVQGEGEGGARWQSGKAVARAGTGVGESEPLLSNKNNC